jgi:sulfide dehydrogenase cytochrome subunit
MKKLSTLVASLAFIASGAAVADTESLARTCNTCHGVNGISAGGAIPSIGGQSEGYLLQIMMQWKSGERASANMTRLISGYSDAQIAALAKHYAAKPWAPKAKAVGADVIARGKEATDRCGSCHGDTGGEPDDNETPRLNGQEAAFLHLELEKYRDDGFEMPHKKMKKNARKLEQADLPAVAGFYGAQGK